MRVSQGEPLSGQPVSGTLCLARPWPGMARSIFRDHQRFIDTYFTPYPGQCVRVCACMFSLCVRQLLSCPSGCYFTGDGALRSEAGFYQITGRMDDVINVSGHRLGTAEIEDALVRLISCRRVRFLSVVSLTVAALQDEHPAIPESAVIGFPHDIKGEGESHMTYRPIVLRCLHGNTSHTHTPVM